MNPGARKALEIIRRCLADGRYLVSKHLIRRMDLRGLFWLDIEAAVESCHEVREYGHDPFGRPRWALAGNATDGLVLEIVCALDHDDAGNLIVFITVYWT